MDQLRPPVGVEALVLGAGTTGLIIAQLLKSNGASRMVIAANEGVKTAISKKLGAADEYVELVRKDPAAQWARVGADNPYGSDAVEATGGGERGAIHCVHRGGTLIVYGVYANDARVHWAPSKIFGDDD